MGVDTAGSALLMDGGRGQATEVTRLVISQTNISYGLVDVQFMCATNDLELVSCIGR